MMKIWNKNTGRTLSKNNNPGLVFYQKNPGLLWIVSLIIN
jgi:hypothetical protein